LNSQREHFKIKTRKQIKFPYTYFETTKLNSIRFIIMFLFDQVIYATFPKKSSNK